jgi:ABC-2 type transport system ATP-binding protein
MQIELKNVSKTIKNKKLLDDVSFLFETGDIIGFIGNNGAGKTTTIKTIFQEYNLTSGEILFNGKPIGSDDLRGIEFFPDQNNFPKNYKVKNYCQYNYMLSNPRANSGDFEKLFSDLADALQLSDNLNSKFSQLSSGMQKRALLLFVLITQPNVLILDEPTANLDVQSRKEFIGLLKTLSDKMHFAIMITSHNIDELETFVNKIVFIKEGRIVLTKKFDRAKESLNELYEKYIATDKPIINEKKLEDIFKNSKGKNEK